MFLSDLIASAGQRLTPTERLLAEAVLADPTLLAFGTVSDLASRVGTSRPSVVRFATKLGFEGYADLQKRVREVMSGHLARPSERIRHLEGVVEPARIAVEAAVAKAFASLDQDRLARLADPIARARNVWVLTGETSQAGARVLYSGMTMIRPGVHWVEEHSSARDLSGAHHSPAASIAEPSGYEDPVGAVEQVAPRTVDGKRMANVDGSEREVVVIGPSEIKNMIRPGMNCEGN